MTHATVKPAEKLVVLGRVSGLYGVGGWVKIHSYTVPRTAILDYTDWLLGQDEEWQGAGLEGGRKHGDTVIAKFSDVDDRDGAAGLVGSDIAVRRASMPTTEVGEYYWTDLEGLEVIRGDGQVLGKVAYMLATGEHDVMVVQGEREVLIPFVAEKFVKDVDLASGVISVDWDWE